MLQYATNDSECRSKFFETYFGLDQSHDCGVCDICLERKRVAKSKPVDLTAQILDILSHKELTIKELIQQVNSSPANITECVEKLIVQNKIILLPSNKLKI